MCGSGVPNVGDRIIVFGCGDNNNVNKNIRLHNFTSFTGYTRWSQKNEDLIMKHVGNEINECGNQVFSERCMKRNLNICKRIRREIEPLRPSVFIEPVLERTDEVEPIRKVDKPIRFRNFFSGFLNRRF